MHWYLEVLKKYAAFSGRARRKEYWMFTLMNIIVTGILEIIMFVSKFNIGVLVVLSLYSFALILPSLGVVIRRLHDTGKSGWCIFLSLIPIAGGIIMLVFMCTNSDPGDNKYGSSPKAA